MGMNICDNEINVYNSEIKKNQFYRFGNRRGLSLDSGSNLLVQDLDYSICPEISQEGV